MTNGPSLAVIVCKHLLQSVVTPYAVVVGINVLLYCHTISLMESSRMIQNLCRIDAAFDLHRIVYY